jgi:hypothetical protein
MRKRLGTATALVTCALGAATAFGGSIHKLGNVQPVQETVFAIETPAPGATVSGIVEVHGYVLDQRGVSGVTLVVDGTELHDADINQPRADVRLKYPGFDGGPFELAPGFTTSFLASNFTDGTHTLAVKVTYSNGEEDVLGQREITVDSGLNQAPIGGVDSPRDPNVAGMQDIVSGAYPVVGWAIDDQGIRQQLSPAGCDLANDADCHILADIEVLVDGYVVGQAIYGLPRPDVANAHPDVDTAFDSGFQMNLDTTRFANGPHMIAVRAWDVLGASRVLANRPVYFSNNYGTLGPFGEIDWPMPNAYMYGTTCRYGGVPSGIEYSPEDRIEWVSGWVVDQQDVQRYVGVKYVELLLDGVVLKRTSTDCDYLDAFQMDVNCYGIERPDILYRYPQFTADAKDSGFFFAIDMDWLVADPPVGRGIHKGLHYLSIRVGTQDPTRAAVVIDQIPVLVECPVRGGYPSFGELEQPVKMQDMQGVELVKGWVSDFENVVTLYVYVDGVLDGSLSVPSPYLHMYRPDLRDRYPWYPFQYLQYSGFEYHLDTGKYVDGVHQLVLRTEDQSGYVNYFVQRPVRFNNPN